MSSGKEKKDFKKKEGKESFSTQGVTCFNVMDMAISKRNVLII